MSTDCETVRLIRYKIAFIKEGFEAILHEEQVVVSSETFDCDGTSFEVWKTAEFFQSLPRDVVAAWKTGKEEDENLVYKYPPDDYLEGDDAGHYTGRYTGIPEEDKKYLRFFQEEEATYERRKDTEVNVLRDIHKQMKEGVKTV